MISAVVNGINYTIIFGSYGRQMGLLSIACLILMSVVALTIGSQAKSQILSFLSISLTVSNIYGFFQFLGFDFLKFEKLYDGINTTFGNPNFAGGAAAVSALLYFNYAIEAKKII